MEFVLLVDSTHCFIFKSIFEQTTFFWSNVKNRKCLVLNSRNQRRNSEELKTCLFLNKNNWIRAQILEKCREPSWSGRSLSQLWLTIKHRIFHFETKLKYVDNHREKLILTILIATNRLLKDKWINLEKFFKDSFNNWNHLF